MDGPDESQAIGRRTIFRGAAGLGAATAVAGLLASSPTASAMGFLVRGTLEGIGDAFEILAFSWGASATEQGRGRGANVQDVSITRWTDATSPQVLNALLTGAVIPSATIMTNKNGGITYELTGVTVTSLSNGGSGGEDRLTENLSLAFTGLAYTVDGESASFPAT